MVRIRGCTRPICVCALVDTDVVGVEADFYDFHFGPRGTIIVVVDEPEPSLFVYRPPEPVPAKTTLYARVRGAVKWFGELSWRPAPTPDFA